MGAGALHASRLHLQQPGAQRGRDGRFMMGRVLCTSPSPWRVNKAPLRQEHRVRSAAA